MEKQKNTVKKGKIKKVIRFFILSIITAIILEFIYVTYKSIKEFSESEAKEFNEKIVEIENGYLIAGSSNFKYSKFNKKTGSTEKARLAIYNSEDKTIKEFKFKKGKNSLFMDAVEDGKYYLAVGMYQKNTTQKNKGETDGLFVKYDHAGNIEYFKSYTKLPNTKFNRILVVDDGYIVVGSTTYNSTSSSEEKGGALILKYDQAGNIKWEETYGENTSGAYNDILEEQDGYLVVGSKDSSTGLIAKYDKNGTFKWKKEISYISENGIRSIKKFKDGYIFCGSFKKSSYATERTNTAVLVTMEKDMNIKKVIEYGEEKEVSQFNNIVVTDKNIYAAGGSAYINKEKTTKKVAYYNNKAIFVKYDLNLKKQAEKIIDKKDIYRYTNIGEVKNKIYAVGYTRAKYERKYADGKNYLSVIDVYAK